MTTYRMTFERIGRSRPEPLTATAEHPEILADEIFRYARPLLASRDVVVVVDMEAMTGNIFCGFQSGGRFTIAEVAP